MGIFGMTLCILAGLSLLLVEDLGQWIIVGALIVGRLAFYLAVIVIAAYQEIPQSNSSGERVIMPKIKYKDFAFRRATMAIIQQANDIIREYQAQGFDLTLRQLYYQFVSRDIIPNTQKSYKNLGGIINDARLAGLIDWDTIVDRTRELRQLSHWTSPSDIIETCASQFNIDRWRSQTYRPEVWIEKDALVGVFERVCNELDVPLLSCRGYTSQSEMWGAGQRLLRYHRNNQIPMIFHFGDHDPSGKDMSRDITDRLEMFTGGQVEFQRLALNMDQVEQYGPPPNPAKITDSRATAYIAEFGDESWELDALEPAVLEALVREAINGIIDKGQMDAASKEQQRHRDTLQAIADRYLLGLL